MGKKQDLLQKLADAMELPGEPIPGRPILELLGDSRIVLEHHRGVLAYSGEKIVVSVSYGELEISGENLELLQMTARQLIVAGPVTAIILKRGSDI